MHISLNDFIQSLSPTEKRYIHLTLKTFSSNKEENKVLTDFLSLEAGIYSLKSKLKIQTNPTRLYYKFLEILHTYHFESLSGGNKDREYLNYANVMVLKGNYAEAIKFLNKIISSGSSNSSNHLVKIEAIELKIKIAIESANVEYLQTDLYTDKLLQDKLSGDYFNLLEYERMWALVKLESTKNYFFGENVDFLKSHEHLLKDENMATTPLAKVYYNKVKGFLSIRNNRLDEVFGYANRTIEIFETNLSLKKSHPQEYLRAIRNLCISYTQVREYDKAEVLLDTIDLSFINTKKIIQHELTSELFTLFILLRMDIIISNDNIENNLDKLTFFENELKKNELLLRNEEKASSYYYLSIFYIHNAEYKKALKYINRAKAYATTVRKDLGQLSLQAEIVVHYFLGNTDLLNSKLLSYKRLVDKNEFVFNFEREVCKSLTRIFSDPNNKELYFKLQKEIEDELEKENKSIYRPFVPLFYLKPIQ